MNETTISPLIAQSASAAGFLFVESGSLAGQRFVLPPVGSALLLGRERMCNVRFDPERDRVVGRNHARIEVRGEGIFLIDLNSANGTFQADGSAVRGEVRLAPGDRFQLGGEGGPWLSWQDGAESVAVHLAPLAEIPTIVTRPAAPAPVPGPAHRAWPQPPAAPFIPRTTAAPEPAPPAFVAPVRLPSSIRPETPPRELSEPQRPARHQPADVDPLALQHQKQYRRQVGVIALLLILACSAGLALGLRDAPPEDGEPEAARPE